MAAEWVDGCNKANAASRAGAETHIVWVENARAVACILVVMLHAAAGYVHNYQGAPSLQWMSANIIDSFARASVPVFFMLTGFLYYARPESPLGRRLKRLLAPLVFFTLLAAAYRMTYQGEAVGHVVREALTGRGYYHLWFLYALVVVQLILGLVRPSRIDPRIGAAMCLLLIGLFSNGTRTLLLELGAPEAWLPRFANLGGFACFMLYALAGYFIGAMQLRGQWRMLAACGGALYIAASIAIAAGTAVVSERSGAFNGAFYAYNALPVTLAAFGLIGLLCALGDRIRLAPAISQWSLGIYGLHPFVLHSIETRLGRLAPDTAADIMLKTLVVLALSWLLARTLGKLDRTGLVLGGPRLRPR